MKPKQLIIIGGGKSISEGIELGLWEALKDRFTIGCNYAYRYLDCTILTYVDPKFQNKNWSGINNIPLKVSRNGSDMPKMSNVYYIPNSTIYHREAKIREGLYSKFLTGVFSLSLAIKLLDIGEIFLLGYDSNTVFKKDGARLIFDNNFHSIDEWHQKVNYNSLPKYRNMFEVFRSEKKCKIYNVGKKSQLQTFDKITYLDFFDKLKGYINQNELRKTIRRQIES